MEEHLAEVSSASSYTEMEILLIQGITSLVELVENETVYNELNKLL